MSWRNALLTYEPIRKGLLELEKLDNGTLYEKEATNHFLGNSISKAVNFATEEIPESITALCKAEVAKAFPNSTEQEINEIVTVRNQKIEQLTDQIASDSIMIMKGLMDGLVAKGTEKFNKQFTELFSDKNLDVLIKFKVSKLQPSLQKAVMEQIDVNLGGIKKE